MPEIIDVASAMTNMIAPEAYQVMKKVVQAILNLKPSDGSKHVADEASMALAQTRIAQEMAIAQRIATAKTVKMTEYYEADGKGSAGFSSDGQAVTLGLAGSGQRISHRVIEFEGTLVPTDVPEEEVHTELAHKTRTVKDDAHKSS